MLDTLTEHNHVWSASLVVISLFRHINHLSTPALLYNPTCFNLSIASQPVSSSWQAVLNSAKAALLVFPKEPVETFGWPVAAWFSAPIMRLRLTTRVSHYARGTTSTINMNRHLEFVDVTRVVCKKIESCVRQRPIDRARERRCDKVSTSTYLVHGLCGYHQVV